MPGTLAGTDRVLTDLGSGCGDAASVSILTENLISVRMILLRTMVGETMSLQPETARMARLSDAYNYLTELQRTHPGEVLALLAAPNTGPWISTVLERLQDAENKNIDSIPLWADCGYLGWLAAAGGMTCLPEGNMALVVRDGIVMLPGIGTATLGAAGYCAECTVTWTSDGALNFAGEHTAVIVPARDRPGESWRPIRRLRIPGEDREIILDDIDPFRVARQDTQVPRLSYAQAQQWQRDFTGAWELLRRELDGYLPTMRTALQSIAPLSAKPHLESVSHTAFNGVGCVYTTAPADSCQLALTLIHEIQHTKLALLIDHVELFEPDPSCRFYAPWRDDPRPIEGLMHGIYSFVGVTDFWRVHRNSACHGTAQSHADFELWRNQVEGAIAQAKGSGLLTADGTRFIDGLDAAMRQWRTENVPAPAAQAASDAATAHATFWQVRNLIPDSRDIADLAGRWDRRREPGALPAVSWIDQDRVPDRYRSLILSVQVKTLDRTATAPISLGQPRGDEPYLAGDAAAAVRHYREELRADPLRPQLWAGLALALPKLHPDNDFRILHRRAEVVAHLYSALRFRDTDPDPIAVSHWLATGYHHE